MLPGIKKVPTGAKLPFIAYEKMKEARHNRKITVKQAKFAQAYLRTGSPARAALEAYDIKPTDRDKMMATAGVMGNYCLKRKAVIEYLEQIAGSAILRVEDISKKAKNESVKLRANQDILDRAGYKPVDKVETTRIDKVYTQEQILYAAQEILQAHKRAGTEPAFPVPEPASGADSQGEPAGESSGDAGGSSQE